MVANPGAPDSGRRPGIATSKRPPSPAYGRGAGGEGKLRPLNRPQPIEVESDDGACPVAVLLSGRRRAVEEVLQTWLIEDEWWRERPVSRLYYSLLLANGQTLTLFHDRVSGSWWRQSY